MFVNIYMVLFLHVTAHIKHATQKPRKSCFPVSAQSATVKLSSPKHTISRTTQSCLEKSSVILP